MKFDAPGELAEILCVLGYDNSILRDCPREDDVIGVPQPASIPRVDRIVQAACIKEAAEGRRNALIDEKPHPALPARRATGRPTCGWVLP